MKEIPRAHLGVTEFGEADSQMTLVVLWGKAEIEHCFRFEIKSEKILQILTLLSPKARELRHNIEEVAWCEVIDGDTRLLQAGIKLADLGGGG